MKNTGGQKSLWTVIWYPKDPKEPCEGEDNLYRCPDYPVVVLLHSDGDV